MPEGQRAVDVLRRGGQVGVLQRFESRLEQMVSGAFAKAFRSAVQPVEVAAALQREVDNSAQILSRNRRLVPNQFHVELSPADHARLSPYSTTLAEELTEMLREHAHDQAYVFTGPVTITFDQRDDLTTGRFRVRSAALAKVTASPERAPTDSAVRRAEVVLEVNGMRHPIEAPGLVVGRGTDADLRINDPGVSRRHAEVRVHAPDPDDPRDTGISVVDLGSTNGIFVNGSRVDRASLRDGDTVKVGHTAMTVHLVPWARGRDRSGYGKSGAGGGAGV
jgi:FHA domain-containing protein